MISVTERRECQPYARVLTVEGTDVIRRLVIVLLAFLAAVPASAKSRDKDYEGPDAGYLIYSVGTIKIGMNFAFSYRQTAALNDEPREGWKGKIEPRLGGAIYLKIKNPHFAGDETGHVVVRRLPPGSYEVNDFSVAGSNLAGTTYFWSPSKPFSLPFKIRAGEATYIGSFMRSPSLGTPLQPVLGAAGFFLVANRSNRDLPIAKGNIPAGINIETEVTDVSKFGSEVLRTSQR